LKRSSNRLVLLVGLFLAVVAFVLIAIMFNNGSGPGGVGAASAAPTTANVVVAATDIALGSKITADSVKTKSIPVGDRPADSYADVSLVIGQTARTPVLTDQLITSLVVNGPGSNGITEIHVPAGYVAISVQVDQVSGVGTLIKAGDHVDVVTGFSTFPVAIFSQLPAATPRTSARPGASPSPSASGSAPAVVDIGNVSAQYDQNSVKTVVEGLQVLGTLLPPTAADATASAKPGTTLNGQQEIVVLAATVQQAEAIRFAQIGGTIALVLRSSTDCQTADGTASACPIIPTSGITLRMMVDSYGVLPPQVVEVLMPTPYPSPMPSRVFPSPTPSPSPVPSDSPAPSGSTAP